MTWPLSSVELYNMYMEYPLLLQQILVFADIRVGKLYYNLFVCSCIHMRVYLINIQINTYSMLSELEILLEQNKVNLCSRA